jgi:molybdate transport system substrate-binding protein
MLAQQIVASSQADIFLSANERWMDHVEKAGRLIAGTRKPVLSNRLVIVAHAATDWQMDEGADLAAIEFEHLSLADPEAVPAGIYAKAFLQRTPYGDETLWDVLSPKVAPALDVRAALALVDADPAVIGIVYRTDARASGHVRILFEIPDSQVPPITYSAARVYRPDAPATAERFFDFLFSREAQAIFVQHGFVPFAQPRSIE